MKRAFVFLFVLFPLPLFAVDVCPAGYYSWKYTELEYIESTGTQYIDTNLSLDSTNLRIVANFIPTSSIENDANILFGTVQKSNIDVFVFQNSKLYSGGNNSGVYTHNETLINKEIVLEDILSINSPRRHMYGTIDGKAFSIQTDSEPIDHNLDVQARILGHTDIYRSKMKLKHLSVYKSGKLSLDLIPVKGLNGEIGMVDMVENKFYGNNGAGEFIAGPEKTIVRIEKGVCVSCPSNTYKPNAGNQDCTPCPIKTFSPIGSTSLNECAKILHVGDYIVYMPVDKRTEHGLCTMLDGVKYCADMYERQ